MNLLTLIKIFLPHLIASIVAEKLSSSRTKSDSSLAALTPEPIAIPISASINDSTSVVPSPVHPTFFYNLSLIPMTSISLSEGRALDKTLILLKISSNVFSLTRS